MSRGLLVREFCHDNPQIIDVPEEMHECAKIIKADICNLIRRYIDDVELYIIVDDCGLLTDRAPTAYGDDVLVGDIIFTQIENPGEYNEHFRDLTDDEINKITSKITRRQHGIMIRDVMHYSNMIGGIDRSLWEAAATVDRDACERLHFVLMTGGASCEDIRKGLLNIVMEGC